MLEWHPDLVDFDLAVLQPGGAASSSSDVKERERDHKAMAMFTEEGQQQESTN